jgi:hypothetical protein
VVSHISRKTSEIWGTLIFVAAQFPILNRAFVLSEDVSSEQKRLLGFAHRFRPTYALANVGHPSFHGGLDATND